MFKKCVFKIVAKNSNICYNNAKINGMSRSVDGNPADCITNNPLFTCCGSKLSVDQYAPVFQDFLQNIRFPGLRRPNDRFAGNQFLEEFYEFF